MTSIAFKRVVFDTSSDPLRAEFNWWEDLDDVVPTTFAIWVKSHADVNRNVLLGTTCAPGSPPVCFVRDPADQPGQEQGNEQGGEVGTVVDVAPGRLVVEFPRSTLAEYGPRISWWGQASLGEEDVDTYVDPDSNQRDLAV
jgi:hypothetical protein